MAVRSVNIPKDLLEFIDGLDNRSKYIVDLIRKDRAEDEETFEEKVKRIVSQMGVVAGAGSGENIDDYLDF